MKKIQAASTFVEGAFDRNIVQATAAKLAAETGGGASCAVVFVSSDYLDDLEEFCEIFRIHGHVPTVIGCTASGFISTGREIENESGFSALTLHLPDIKITAMELPSSHVSESNNSAFWSDNLKTPPDQVQGWIALCDPYHFPSELWLRQWNQSYPGIPTLGGLASAHPDPEQTAVFLNGKRGSGAVVLGFSGDIELRTVVSQGCRPIGEPLTITKVTNNIVLTLGGIPAYEVLSQAFSDLSKEDKQIARGSLFAGLASSEYLEEYKLGDFLIRPILAADPNSGAIALGDQVRTGQTMQYQLRDSKSAHEELADCLKNESKKKPAPLCSLLFSCTGRGNGFFGVPHHDAIAIGNALGPIPTAGFFCNGEIGPVGGSNFLHGYTASIAFLAEKKS